MHLSQDQQKLNGLVIRGLILTFVVMLFALFASYFLTAVGLQGLPYSSKFIITRLLYWLCLGVVYLYVTRQEKQSILLWREKNYGIGFYIISVLGLLPVISQVLLFWRSPYVFSTLKK